MRNPMRRRRPMHLADSGAKPVVGEAVVTMCGEVVVYRGPAVRPGQHGCLRCINLLVEEARDLAADLDDAEQRLRVLHDATDPRARSITVEFN